MSSIDLLGECIGMVQRASAVDPSTRAALLAEVDCRLANAERDGSLPAGELAALRAELARMAEVEGQ